MNENIKALLFDFDGTLLDSFSTHLEIYKIMFKHFGIEITKNQYLNSYSPNWYEVYKSMGLPKDAWEEADIIWLREASKRKTKIFATVKQTLSLLYEYYVLGLVTAGSRGRIHADLKRNEIMSLFQVLVTGDDVQNQKPAPDGLELALKQLNMTSTEAIYIGDSYADYEMARAANVAFIWIKSPFTPVNAEPSYVQLNKIEDLPKLLGLDKKIL
ncbi:MAG: HAD family hydrolase, partial [Promethearchaeota archaeon]